MTNYRFRVLSKASDKEISTIHRLLNPCFWSRNIPISYIRRFLRYSLCFAAYDNPSHTIVGFGRVISDYTTYAYICDIVVASNHRKRGIASQLVELILEHPELQGLKTWSLRTSEQARSIYIKKGFVIASEPNTQLEINDLNIYTKNDFKDRYIHTEPRRNPRKYIMFQSKL